MNRRALIIYCDDTSSEKLKGPIADNRNLIRHLRSNLGGDWHNHEIHSLQNPTKAQVQSEIRSHLNEADYSFIVYSGHGGTNTITNKIDLELQDGDITLNSLVLTSVDRQTIILDACRTHYTPSERKAFMNVYDGLESFSEELSTRSLFESLVLDCEKGVTVLCAAGDNEAAADNLNGAPYLSSLIKVCSDWKNVNQIDNKLSLKSAHEKAIIYMREKYITTQNPEILAEKRKKYYPFAVKFVPIMG